MLDVLGVCCPFLDAATPTAGFIHRHCMPAATQGNASNGTFPEEAAFMSEKNNNLQERRKGGF